MRGSNIPWEHVGGGGGGRAVQQRPRDERREYYWCTDKAGLREADKKTFYLYSTILAVEAGLDEKRSAKRNIGG